MLYYSKTLEYVENFSRVKDLPLLRAELVRHGYSPVEIAKILGGNWTRVFGQAWNSGGFYRGDRRGVKDVVWQIAKIAVLAEPVAVPPIVSSVASESR